MILRSCHLDSRQRPAIVATRENVRRRDTKDMTSDLANLHLRGMNPTVYEGENLQEDQKHKSRGASFQEVEALAVAGTAVRGIFATITSPEEEGEVMIGIREVDMTGEKGGHHPRLGLDQDHHPSESPEILSQLPGD